MRVDENRITATYLLASRRHGTLYLGSALDLWSRVRDHRLGIGSAFTRKYGVTRLVWYERHVLVKDARDQEYTMKRWRREVQPDRTRQSKLGGSLPGAAR